MRSEDEIRKMYETSKYMAGSESARNDDRASHHVAYAILTTLGWVLGNPHSDFENYEDWMDATRRRIGDDAMEALKELAEEHEEKWAKVCEIAKQKKKKNEDSETLMWRYGK